MGLVLVLAGVLGASVSCTNRNQPQVKHPSYVTSGQVTTAHPSVMAAAKDYFDDYPTHVKQPIAFTHKVHLKNGMQCTDCHKGVADGPDASLPSVQLCMTCHQVIATDKPEIKKVAAYQKKGEQIPWRRVYWFYQSAHVKFRHGPHIRAGVDCVTCQLSPHTQGVNGLYGLSLLGARIRSKTGEIRRGGSKEKAYGSS